MKRFEIWLADLPKLDNSHIQCGSRPVVIVSNDAANANSTVITVVLLTSQRHKLAMPTHVCLRNQGLERDSIALCEQVMPVDKRRLTRRIGSVYDSFDQLALHHALAIQLDMAA